MQQAQPETNTANLLTFVGVIDTVTHANPETGYGVLKLRVELKDYGHYPCVSRKQVSAKQDLLAGVKGNNQKGIVTLVGNIARIGVGEKVKVSGELKYHKTYGNQIEVTEITALEPKTQTEIQNYLAKNIFQIGRKTAEAIVRKFGDQTLTIIENEPNRLLEVAGIGESRLKEIMEVWAEQRSFRELLLFTTSIGLPAGFIERIYKKYKDKAIQKIKDDPYALARDIWGIGFAKADQVARHLGIQELSEIRIRAAAESILYESNQDGHCFLFAQELLAKTAEFLNHPSINPEAVAAVLRRAIEIGILVCEDNSRMYLREFADAEKYVANRLQRLIWAPMPGALQGETNVHAVLNAAASASSVQLDKTQCEAIFRTLTSKVSVITGGPGTGKTTITKAVCVGFERSGIAIELMAPTGRAAKRMSEVIGRNAQTIHRVLFAKQKALNKGEPLEALLIHGVVIVDEFSMVDLKLFGWLLKFLGDDVILVIVGDKDQLPSVGAGAVLRDLLNSGVIPATQLTHIFRQAAGSNIIVNAHKINEGVMPMWTYFGRNHGYPSTSDMWVAIIDEAEQQADAVIWSISNICPSFNLDPIRDCQVLAPMKNGPAGVVALNIRLQRLLNPNPSAFVERGGGVRWGIGDKMMQMKNDYGLGVLNGDIGVISDIELNDRGLCRVEVDFDGFKANYRESEQWSGLQLAYCSTIHKVQGSEFPMMVMVLHTSHFMLLQRNLLYTAVTRGKKLDILIANGTALSRAVQNNEVSRRNTYLSEKLAVKLQTR